MNSTNSLVFSRLRRRRTVKGPARLVAVLVAVALTASLSACGDEPVEYFTPPPATPTPDVVVSDEPEVFERPDVRLIHPPQKPDVMLDLSEESALAFAHYFVDVLNYTVNSGDTSVLEEISGPECRYCQVTAKVATELEEAGGWAQDFAIEFTSEPELNINTGLVFAYDIELNMADYSTYNSEGQTAFYSSVDLVGALIVYRLGEYWLVKDMGSKADEQ